MNAMLGRYSKDLLMKLANADIPFLSMGAASKLVMKHGMKFTDFKNLKVEEADQLQTEACWTGYKQVGLKKKGNRMVPNCVPESVVREMFGDMINEINDLRGSFTDAQLERMKQEWKNKPASAMTQGVKQMIMNLDAPTRAALENAKINHISKFAGSTFEQKEEVDPSCKICEGEGCECAQGEDFTEASLKEFKKMVVTIKDPIKRAEAMKDIQRFGKRTGFRIDKMSDGKSFRIDGKGADLNKFATDMKNFYGAEIKAESIEEADLSKSQVKMVHKKADKMPKQDFIKRYGKDGDSVRFATATNMVKKKLGIEEEEFVPEQKQKGDNMNEATYKDKFKAAMKDFGINSLDDLKSDADKKKFFKHVDGMHTAKNEELIKEYGTDSQGNDGGMLNAEMMRKEMMKKMEMMKAEKDPEKMEMMKKEMMKEMDKMPEMMKKEMMKKMEMAMKEGFASDAQRKAAFASGYKEKGKKKKEEKEELEESIPGSIFNFERQFKDKNKDAMVMMTKGNHKGRVFVIDKDKLPMMQRQGAVQVENKSEAVKEMMKMNAMKMPVKSSYMKSSYKKEMKTGDDDMKPDAVKLNAMIKDPHKSKEDKPMKDMNAMYMKSDVRADVKNNGGADMSKVKDAPKMQTAMKKINAMYGEDKKYLKTKPGSLEEAVKVALSTKE